jgi:hypothetical protein
VAALVVGKLAAAWLSGRIFDLEGAEVGLMFSMSVAQAAATLAATIVGLEAGLYGDDVVNAVMVVVALSLVMTSIGTDRYAPKIPVPVAERRQPGEAVLLPTVGVNDDELAVMAHLAGRLTDAAGGALQPIVVATSTAADQLESARSEVARADRVLSRAGLDVDTELRIDRSVAFALSRAAIQDDSTLLLLRWPGRTTIRSYVFGASYAEIVAATSVPVLIAALHDELDLGSCPIALVADEPQPGHLPSVELGAQVARTLAGNDRQLAVGPIGPQHFAGPDLDLPGRTAYYGGDGLVDWVQEHTTTRDLVVIPFTGTTVHAAAHQIYDAGRSVLAVSSNPGTQSALGGSTMSLPIGGTINPG